GNDLSTECNLDQAFCLCDRQSAGRIVEMSGNRIGGAFTEFGRYLTPIACRVKVVGDQLPERAGFSLTAAAALQDGSWATLSDRDATAHKVRASFIYKADRE